MSIFQVLFGKRADGNLELCHLFVFVSFCVLYLSNLYHYITLYLCCALYRRVSQQLGPRTDFIELME